MKSLEPIKYDFCCLGQKKKKNSVRMSLVDLLFQLNFMVGALHFGVKIIFEGLMFFAEIPWLSSLLGILLELNLLNVFLFCYIKMEEVVGVFSLIIVQVECFFSSCFK